MDEERGEREAAMDAGAADDVIFAVEEGGAADVVSVVSSGLDTHDREQVGTVEFHDVVVSARAQDGDVVGGLAGTIGGGWLYVHKLWVATDDRGRGIGSDLLRKAEREAVRCGCPRVFLNTLSFQSPRFYVRNGYTQFAELEAAPAPHSRIFFRKDLAD